MANEGIERIGVETVVLGLDKFTSGMKSYNDSLNNAIKTTTSAPLPFDNLTTSITKTGKATDSAVKPVEGLSKVITNLQQKVVGSIPGLNMFAPAIQAVSTASLGTIAAVGALGAAIFLLGKRGAEVRGVQTAFYNLIGSMDAFANEGEDVDDFLNSLSRAAGDTIAEFELMRLTNLALAGTTGTLKEEFAAGLPDLLEIARVQATATGQSVEFLFDSLVRGVKRGSKLIIDNTGLVLDTTAANQAYAESIGKTVEQLTDQEETIALLNATIAAGNVAIEAAGGIQETAATKLARAMALIQNTIDSIAVGVEPLFGLILDGINFVLKGIEGLASFIGPILRDIFKGIGSLITGFLNLISPITNSIAWVINSVIKLFTDARPAIVKGAASIIVAIADAFLWAANTFIIPVVTQIAQFIADFLSGFSPPKRGPLSNIDTGAANVMEAWMEGFTGAFAIQPIQQVAAEVNAALGSIATLGITQVENRLKQLDNALRPFQERVKLLEDRFNALREPAEAALRAIDRSLEKATEALLSGDEGAANLVRQLNIQKEAIQDRLALDEQRVDAAKIQLALAAAQQQQERTLLEIQKARLGSEKKVTEERQRQQKEKGKGAGKEPKPGGGAAPIDAGIGAGAGVMPVAGETPSFLTDVGTFFGDIGSEIGMQLGDSAQFQEFATGIGGLSTQFDRIASSNPVQAISAAFAGLPDAIGTIIDDAIRWIGDPTKEGGLANIISRIADDPIGTLGDIATSLTMWLNGALTPVSTFVANVVAWLGDPTFEGGLANFFSRIVNEGLAEVLGIGDIFASITEWIDLNLLLPFVEFVNSVVDPEREGSIPFRFNSLMDNISTAIGDPLAVIRGIFQGFADWVMGQTEDGGLPGVISSLIGFFGEIPNAIWNALQGLGRLFWGIFVKPVLDGINWVIDKFNEFFNSIAGPINDALVSLGIMAPGDDTFKIEIARISTAPPAWLTPPPPPVSYTPVGALPGVAGGARGGLFSPGALQVGERGRELVASAKPFAVFSNQFVRAMDMMSNAMMNQMVFGGSVPVPMGAGGGNTTDNRSITVNANTHRGSRPQDIAQEIAMTRVFN